MSLNNSPVLFKSVTQKHVALSVTEAELYAAVKCVQEMIYCKNVLNNIGLQVTVLSDGSRGGQQGHSGLD